MRKNIFLSFAFLLLSLSFTISPALASARHTTKGGEKRYAAKRRTVKRRAKAQPQLVTYTCPMHHDVHLKSPGDCPKCGMELEAEKPGR